KAGETFHAACEHPIDDEDTGSRESRGRACSLLGALYLPDGGLPTDLVRGREMTELGCDRGDSFGCFNAATIYANGTGVAHDAAQAAEFFEKACELGDGEGCAVVAAAYDKGDGVRRDAAKAGALR